MPPKAKFSRDEIEACAFTLVRREGLSALTARALGEALGSSPRPIFTVFSNMEAVQAAVLDRARALYRDYISRGLAQTPAFKGVGMAYIRFAREEPKLFQLLFMTERPDIPDLGSVLPLLDERYGDILASVTAAYPLNADQAEALYQHLWVYTHGIAVLCATKVCRFEEAELSRLLTEVFTALLRREMEK